MSFLTQLFKFRFVGGILSVLSERQTQYLGIRGDNQSETPNPGVHEFGEIVGASAPASFPNKKWSDVATYFKQYQWTQSSCVAHTLAKICSILYFKYKGALVKFSPGFWYRQRFNFPEEGMWFGDIQKLGQQGALLYDLMPTEGLNEIDLNNLKIEQYHKDVADGFKLPENWVNVPIDFDTVAATLEKTGKPMMVWFRFGRGEWFGQSVPKKMTSDLVFAHSVTAIESYSLNGVQYIRVEDSAESEKWQKDITRDFFSRCYLARYPINFKFIQGDKPIFDGSIISLQKCLVYELILPSNITFAENVGPLTSKGLITFQKKYGLLETGRFDTATTEKIRQLYS